MGRDGTPTRNKILNASRALVLENGYAGTTVDMILDKTGITKGAFFYHFKSKTDLAVALINDYAKNDRAEMEHAKHEVEAVKDPLEQLLRFVQFFIDMPPAPPDVPNGCLYASYSYEANHFNPEIRTTIKESILLWRETFTLLLQNTLAKYKPNIAVDTKTLADQFTVIFEGGFVISKILDNESVITEQLQHLKNYFELLFIATPNAQVK